MKRLNLLVACAFVVMTMFVVVSQAQALQMLKTYKVYNVNIIVTPSPTPVGFVAPPPEPGAVNPGGLAFAQAFYASFGRGLRDNANGYAGPDAVIAQTTVQPTPVPVSLNPQADPNAAYLQVLPQTPILYAPYGTTTFPCAFKIMTSYPSVGYALTDWGYGTKASGSGPFPIMNYPTTSYLSWTVPDLSATVHAYSNSGSPGQTTWTGTANQTQTHCIDLTLTVPNSQPAGNYSASVQYNLYIQ